MKKTITLILALLVLIAGTGFFVSDRDRGMWLMNSAMHMANSRPVVSDLAYGSDPWQKLDVYPAQSADVAPVVVFIHGGSWKHGRKDQYFFAADAFLRLGYTVVLSDYKQYPAAEAKYPSFVVDAALTLKWVKDNIKQYNGSPENIFLVGHSAGAHTAIMLATDGQYLQAQGLSESDIRAVAGIAGPYSFVPNRVHTEAIFGPPANYPNMDALNFVDGAEPATLLLHSEADQQVGQYNQEKLAQRLSQYQVDTETRLYPDLSHIEIVLHLHPWFSKQINVANDIDDFFRRRLSAN